MTSWTDNLDNIETGDVLWFQETVFGGTNLRPYHRGLRNIVAEIIHMSGDKVTFRVLESDGVHPLPTIGKEFVRRMQDIRRRKPQMRISCTQPS